jgi:hypothetical protein
MIDLTPYRDVFAGGRVALYDIDGVIADERHRQPYALRREWADYFVRMPYDTVWRQGRELYEAATITGWTVGYLTGRREDTRGWTVNWLQDNGFDHRAPLLMRPQEERAPLAELKTAVLRGMLDLADEVILYDDDPEVIACAQQIGGRARAVYCGWHVKPQRMVKRALA